jgi:hypothetical protein
VPGRRRRLRRGGDLQWSQLDLPGRCQEHRGLPAGCGESCDGVNNNCPADVVQPIGAVCRLSAGPCDVQEVCTGLSGVCPPDATIPDGAPCNDNNTCTGPDTCQAGICSGTPDPGSCADHYLCYMARRQSVFTPALDVRLVDQFEDIRVDVSRIREICTPADKNGEGVIDSATHINRYMFKARVGQPRFVRRRNIQIDNQLTGSPFRIEIFKRDLLLVPTNKSLVGPTTPPAGNVEHYKCYRAKPTPGQPRFQAQNVTVLDQFIPGPPKQYTVKRLRQFCTPVDKNNEGMVNPNAHLACYQVKAVRGQPRHIRQTGVNTANQFGSLVVGTIRDNSLCIPSLKTILP